jgi:hypothetical protein
MNHDESYPIGILNERSRWDLIDQIKDHSQELQSLDHDELYRLLFDIKNSLHIEIGHRDPTRLRLQFGARSTDDSIVNKYTKMVLDGVVFDPVFVCDDEFIDGGHRVQAYINANKALIPVINLSALQKIDWQDWLNNPKAD